MLSLKTLARESARRAAAVLAAAALLAVPGLAAGTASQYQQPSEGAMTLTSAQDIQVGEPGSYKADMVIRTQLNAANAQQFPPLQFQIGKTATDRMIAFTLPNVGRVVYLNDNNTKYLVFPDRKQYVVLNEQELGFQIPNLLMPARIADQLRAAKGVQRAGTEIVNGRQTIVYTTGATAQTNTQVGNVMGMTKVFVDQETGLPLRANFDARAQSGQTADIVVEMQNLDLSVGEDLYTIPQDYAKVTSQELKQQFNAAVEALRSITLMVRVRPESA